MNRKLLVPALVSISLVASVIPASAGAMFDFIPRMDFYDQPELVTKDKSKATLICDTAQDNACSTGLKTVTPKSPKNADK